MDTIEPEINPKQPNFRISAEASAIIKRLETANEGDVVTYEELNKLIDGDVQDGRRSALDTARRNLMKRQIVFGTVTGIGIKRLDPSGINERGKHEFGHIRKKTKRTLAMVMCADSSRLNDGERVQHGITVNGLRGVELFTRKSSLQKVEQRIISNGSINLGETMKLFAGQ